MRALGDKFEPAAPSVVPLAFALTLELMEFGLGPRRAGAPEDEDDDAGGAGAVADVGVGLTIFTAGIGVNTPAPAPVVAGAIIAGAAAILPLLDRLSCCNPATLPLLGAPPPPPPPEPFPAEGDDPETCTLTSNPAALPLLCSISAFCFCFTASIARTCSNAVGSCRWIVKPITTGEMGVEGPVRFGFGGGGVPSCAKDGGGPRWWCGEATSTSA